MKFPQRPQSDYQAFGWRVNQMPDFPKGRFRSVETQYMYNQPYNIENDLRDNKVGETLCLVYWSVDWILNKSFWNKLLPKPLKDCTESWYACRHWTGINSEIFFLYEMGRNLHFWRVISNKWLIILLKLFASVTVIKKKPAHFCLCCGPQKLTWFLDYTR